jgi:hypothetical protein
MGISWLFPVWQTPKAGIRFQVNARQSESKGGVPRLGPNQGTGPGLGRCEGLEHIGEVWKQLVLWFEDSPYQKPPHWQECLENLLVHPHTPFEDYVFDLHLAIQS